MASKVLEMCLIWPTHKWLCKRPKYSFSFAPLSALEHTQALDVVRSDPAIAEEFTGKMQPDCLNNEPLRPHMLIEVHWMIRFGTAQRLVTASKAEPSAWYHVAFTWQWEKDLVLEAADIAPELFKDRRAYGHLGPSHLTVFNAMHRHLLPLPPTLDGEAAVGALANLRVVLVQSALHPDEAFFFGQVVSKTFVMAAVDDMTHERTTEIVKEEYRGENYKWPEGWPAVKGWPPS
ncbi:hypothetical protein JCM10450v2_001570 [Rhodotorula kratochvilovae]